VKIHVRLTAFHGAREFTFPGEEVEFFEHIQFLMKECGNSRTTEFGACVGPAIEIRKFPETEDEKYSADYLTGVIAGHVVSRETGNVLQSGEPDLDKEFPEFDQESRVEEREL
jgi:hypothetical protein